MFRRFTATAAAAVLFCAGFANAQDLPSRAAGERIAAIQAILSEPDGVPALFNEPSMVRARATGSLDDAAIAIRTIQPGIDREQARLQRAIARLHALPPMEPSDDQAAVLDQAVRDAVRSSRDMDGFLSELEVVLAEIDAGDAERARAGFTRLRGVGFAMIDNRSVMMRTRAAMIPEGISERFSALAGAEAYKGMGQIVRMAHGFSAAAETAESLNAATSALEANVARGRVLLAEEVRAISDLPPSRERDVSLQLLDLQGQVFTAYADALTVLKQANAGTGADVSPEVLSTRMAQIGAGFTPVEQRLVALNNEMMTTLAGLRR